MLLALSAMTGMFLDFFGIDNYIFSFFGGVSVLPLAFIYIASFVFGFCVYHRMFLHYVVANNVLTYIDFTVGIPIDNYMLFCMHIFLIGLFLFLVLFFYRKERCCKR